MARLAWVALLVWFVAADGLDSGPIAGGGSETPRGSEPDGDTRPKLRLKLVADPQVGFMPLTTMLTGTLTGVAPDDPNFCHPAVTWIRVNPGQLEENASRYHQESACRHPPGEGEAMTTFTRIFDLYRPGSYLLKLVVEGKDHRRAESAFVQIQVLRVQ